VKGMTADLRLWTFGLVKDPFRYRSVAVVSTLLRVECGLIVASTHSLSVL
jgi:hypothetical protein